MDEDNNDSVKKNKIQINETESQKEENNNSDENNKPEEMDNKKNETEEAKTNEIENENEEAKRDMPENDENDKDKDGDKEEESDKEKETKLDEDKNEDEEEEKKKKDKMDMEEEDKKEDEEETPKERSVYSLEGGKPPLSLYTRRVMDVSKINNYLSENSTRGQCGGHNLGNTCFMNSSIACISNCTELTYYFLKGDYKKDINTENNLGMHGDLAISWGNLLKEYWVENTHVGDPSDFKRTIGRKAVRFRGYNQHDSNEFMSIFLDYLNEDLNRTTKKEYIELKEKQENETDEQCARRFWDCNLRRNDSIITDLFCGQFKSTITCPDCGYINITFDPFDTINLPMINRNKNRHGNGDILDEFKLFYVPKYCLRDPICLRIKTVNENEYIDNVIDRIKKENTFVYHDKIDKLLMVDVYHKRKHEYIQRMQRIRGYTCDNENVFAFDIMDKDDKLFIPIYYLEKDDTDAKSEFPRIVFGKKDMTLDDLRKKIYFNLRKYILSPLLKENEEKDSLSIEIEKYCNDEKLELDDEKLFELIEKEYQQVFKSIEEDEKDEEGKEDKEDKDKENEEEKEKEDEDKKDDEKKEEEMDIEKDKEEKKEEKKEEEKEEVKNMDIENEIKDNKEENKEETKEKENKTDKPQDENEKYIKQFKEDMPFKIYLKKSYSDNVIIVDSQYFTKLSPDLKKLTKLKSFKDSLEDIYDDIEDCKIYVEFNENSKYINKDKYNLDYCKVLSMDYEIKKKEEKKKEDEEEDDGRLTLEKCLKKFTKEEQLQEGDEWYCSRCKKHVKAKKKMEFYYLPKILIICFKRFIKESYRWEKNGDNVEFPINDFDMKDIMIGPDREHSKYDLFAVSQHYGSTGFGHYTAVCKNNGKWFSYDDSSCHETNPSSCQTSAAYVLFYRRQTD